MKSLRNWNIIVIFISVCILGACSKAREALPLVDTATCGDFTLTISTPKSRYKARELSPDNLLDLEISTVYHGDEPEIMTWHDTTYYGYQLVDENGEPLLYCVWDLLYGSTVFLRDEPQIVYYDGYSVYEYFSNTIPKGAYRAQAFIRLWLDEDMSQLIECSVEVPIIIE